VKKALSRLFLAVAIVSIFVCSERRKSVAVAVATPSPAVTLAPPTPEEARALIAASAEFSDYQFTNASFSLPLKRSGMNEPTRSAAKDLAAAGWIRFQGDEVQLTQKALGDKRWLVRPNGFVDVVPLARKELTELAAVQKSDDGNVKANFCWRWSPNEIGSAFKGGMLQERFTSMQCAIVTLQPGEGGGWEVLLLENNAPQSPAT